MLMCIAHIQCTCTCTTVHSPTCACTCTCMSVFYVTVPVCFQPFKINQIYFACFSEVFGVTPDLTTQVGVHCALEVEMIVAVPLTLSFLHHPPFLLFSSLLLSSFSPFSWCSLYSAQLHGWSSWVNGRFCTQVSVLPPYVRYLHVHVHTPSIVLWMTMYIYVHVHIYISTSVYVVYTCMYAWSWPLPYL